MLGLNTITFGDLGGIQTRKALTKFSPRDALSAVGGRFEITGAYTKRRGGEKYNTTSLGATGTGIYDFRYSNDTQQKILIGAGGSVYHGNAGSPSSIKSGLTSGAFLDFATYDDFAFFCNGSDGLFKYNGTTVTNAGVDRPGSAPTLGQSTGGSLPLTSTYQIAVTFVTAGEIESNPCDTGSFTLTSTNNRITLTSIPTSGDTQVTKRRIYVSTANGSILRVQQTINDNTTTTANVDTEGTGALLEYDHDDPPSGLKGIEVFKDRLWGFKNDVLYFTKDFYTWYWPQGELDSEIDFRAYVGNSDPMTGLKSFFDFFLIFKKLDVYILSGDNELNFRVDRIRSDERIGCVSDRTIRIIENYCYFVGINGVYRTNGITIEKISRPIDDFFDQNSSSTTYKINKTYLPNACAEYYPEKNVYMFFCAAGSGTTNNMCFALNTKSIRIDEETGDITADWNPWPGFTTQAVGIINESGIDRWFRIDDVGYVFRMERLDGDGANVTSTATSATSTTLSDSIQAWTTNLYSGLRVNILSGTGSGQERTISSNTATQLTVSSSWTTTPDTTSVYSIGGVPYHYQHSWHDYEQPTKSKRWRYARPRFETNGSYGVNIFYGFDFQQSDGDQATYTISGIALMDVALWDVALFDGIAILQNRLNVPGNRIHRWSNFKIENNAAGQAVKYMGFDKIWQLKGMR